MKLNIWQWIGLVGVVVFGGLYLYRSATQPADQKPAVTEPSREAPIVVPPPSAAPAPVPAPVLPTTLPTTKPA